MAEIDRILRSNKRLKELYRKLPPNTRAMDADNPIMLSFFNNPKKVNFERYPFLLLCQDEQTKGYTWHIVCDEYSLESWLDDGFRTIIEQEIITTRLRTLRSVELYTRNGKYYFLDERTEGGLENSVEDTNKKFDLEKIILIGKQNHIRFTESYGLGKYCLSIWAKNKKSRVGRIEVDKTTRTTIKKEVLPKYQELADFIEHVFKTTKQKAYPMEFYNTLDKI